MNRRPSDESLSSKPTQSDSVSEDDIMQVLMHRGVSGSRELQIRDSSTSADSVEDQTDPQDETP